MSGVYTTITFGEFGEVYVHHEIMYFDPDTAVQLPTGTLVEEDVHEPS